MKNYIHSKSVPESGRETSLIRSNNFKDMINATRGIIHGYFLDENSKKRTL